MNSIIEVSKFKPGTTFENTISEIKYNHLKSIASATMNISTVAFFYNSFKQLSMNINIEVAKFEPGPTFEKTINDIKDNHLKIIASATMNLLAITLFENNLEQISTNREAEVEKFEPEPTF